MADKEIIQLTAISSQVVTDLYEVSANGTGSFKETRTQMVNYIQAHLNNVSITGGTIDNTSIGGSTPVLGRFSTLTFTSVFNSAFPIALNLYVDISGSDANIGDFYNPFATIGQANSVIGDNQIISIGQYAFTEGAIAIHPVTGWKGNGPNETFITTDGLSLAVNWAAFGSPYIDLQDLNIFDPIGIDFYAPGYASGSSINITNCIIDPATSFSAGLVDNVNIINSSIDNALFTDVGTGRVINGKMTGLLTIAVSDSTHVTSQNWWLNGLDITQLNINNNTSVPINILVTNCPNLGTGSGIVQVNTGVDSTLTLTFDTTSYPVTISNIGGSSFTTNYIFNAKVVNTTAGFANGWDFSWSGSSTYTLTAGHGAHITGGTDNILLGKGATSNHTGTFVFADSTNTTGGNYFPHLDNQACFWVANGFGIGVSCSGGIQGPQAGFHYANNFGNDGKFLFCGKGAVTTGNMSANEINPYMATDTLNIQAKGSTGTAQTITFPSGSSTLANNASVVHNTGNESISGTKTFNDPTLIKEIQNPLVINRVPTNLTATTATISAAQLVGGDFTLNPTLAATYTLPLGTDVDTALNTPNPNRGMTVLFVNQSAVAATISGNTNFNTNGAYLTGGIVVIPAGSQRRFDIIKIDNTPTYSLFG